MYVTIAGLYETANPVCKAILSLGFFGRGVCFVCFSPWQTRTGKVVHSDC